MLWCFTKVLNLSFLIVSTDCKLNINIFEYYYIIGWQIYFSDHPAVLFAELTPGKCCNSSWTCDQKQATYGQYQNKWSNDSVSSQLNLQSWEGYRNIYIYIYNILLVVRILYTVYVLNPASFCILVHKPCAMESVRWKSQLFCNIYGTAVNFLVLKWNGYTFLFITIFLNQCWSLMHGRQTSSLLFPLPLSS